MSFFDERLMGSGYRERGMVMYCYEKPEDVVEE